SCPDRALVEGDAKLVDLGPVDPELPGHSFRLRPVARGHAEGKALVERRVKRILVVGAFHERKEPLIGVVRHADRLDLIADADVPQVRYFANLHPDVDGCGGSTEVAE